MREGHRANALLVELLLVILFFMLGATTLVELFAGAKHKSLQARATNLGIMEAENVADDLYGAEDPDAVLQELGFTKENDEGRYSNGTFVVWDVLPRNVLVDADGDIYVVDAEIKKQQ